MSTWFSNLLAAAVLVFGVAAISIAESSPVAKSTADCCAVGAACCPGPCCETAQAPAQVSAVKVAAVKADCCFPGAACCEAELACCTASPSCCETGEACCAESLACCTDAAKSAKLPAAGSLVLVKAKSSCCSK